MTLSSSLISRRPLGALAAITKRDFLISTSYRLAFALDTVFGLINLFIYYFISKVFDTSSISLGAAPSYFSFVAVGATITIVIQAASTSMATRLREEQLTGTLEALVTHPVASNEVAIGLAAFPFLFATARAVVYLAFADAFLGLNLSHPSAPGFAILLVTSAAGMSAIGIGIGSLTLLFKRAESVAPLVTLALGIGGGAFFPIGVLPTWIHPLAALLPTRWVFDGFRQALFLGSGWGGDALRLAIFGIVALPLALVAFSMALHRARIKGTLGQY
ncbi:MAG: ABC transporter permease [Actinomycetota bacterium]|nr:ABC transporter permease [Actinomycetota bacterium]